MKALLRSSLVCLLLSSMIAIVVSASTASTFKLALTQDVIFGKSPPVGAASETDFPLSRLDWKEPANGIGRSNPCRS